MPKKIIVIVGPTAAGKSAIALALAKEVNGYLISADSRQVFSGMDIGTNKDVGAVITKNGRTVRVIDGIDEYLTDVVEPNAYFTVIDWLEHVIDVIEHDSRTPIVVGGTGMYTSALVERYTFDGGERLSLREALNTRLDEEGLDSLVRDLLEKDPAAKKNVALDNPRRVIRALEKEIIGVSEKVTPIAPADWKFLVLGKTVERDELYEKINTRVDTMVADGLVEEVKTLFKKGYRNDSPAMTGIGYRQVIAWLNGKITQEEAIVLIKRDTRRYAKRQITWYKKNPPQQWVHGNEDSLQLVKQFLESTFS